MANKKIIDLVLAKKQSMLSNPAEAGQNTTMAIAAMKGGIQSPEWRAYMMQFVEQGTPGIQVDERQLNRLLGTDETKDAPEMDRKRAYLIGNAPCMDATTGNFDDGVKTIDEGIAADCEPAEPAATQTGRYGTQKTAAKKSGAKKAAAKK